MVGEIPTFFIKWGGILTKEEKKEWEDLYEYVKIEVLGYNDKILPRNFILRLKGLASGKFMANKKIKANASYSYKEILLTFKLSNAKIQDYLSRNNGSFSDESHKFNGIMVIVESEINNTVDIINRKKQAVEKVDVLDSSHHTKETAEYKVKGKVTNNKDIERLL